MHELISKSLSCLCHDLEIKTLVVVGVCVGVGECKIVKQQATHEIDYLREFKTIAGT